MYKILIEHVIQVFKAGCRRTKYEAETAEPRSRLKSKKNCKFQTRCIQIAKEILNEEYHPPFLNGLELDAFFQKYQIALVVTSWYKDAKKLEDIVNRDRQKRCICQDNGIFLLEVWYDQNPEIVIPERIRKIKECYVSQVPILRIQAKF
ncbi:21166_t:CDS:2 [Rhizophagus irregularis]|nr:21166_t:CDS:2 [Rhizophagus irregularis]